MYLNKITLYQYRNLKDSELYFVDGINFISGNNAQGKSNLLESIYLLANGKTFRPGANIYDLTKEETQEASVFGEVVVRQSEQLLGVSIRSGRRSYYVNGEKQRSLVSYLGNFPCYAFTPDDLQLVKSGPSLRREFIDRALSIENPSYLDMLLRYEKALKSKSKLLSEGVSERAAVESLNDILAEYGSFVEEKRHAYIKRLSCLVKEIHRDFASADGELSISIKGCLANDFSFSAYREALEQISTREFAAGRCLYGVQRDDYEITLNSKLAKSYASQGQCRSIVLSLVIAATRKLESVFEEKIPLLLDDVESELDEKRLASFLSALGVSGRQIFITGTRKREKEEVEFLGTEVRFFLVENGLVHCDK